MPGEPMCLLACLSLVALFVQASHPACIHLKSLIPALTRHHACPLSHVAAALLIALLWFWERAWRSLASPILSPGSATRTSSTPRSSSSST